MPFHTWRQRQHLPSSNLLELNEAPQVIRLRHRANYPGRQPQVVSTDTRQKSIGPHFVARHTSSVMRAPIEGF